MRKTTLLAILSVIALIAWAVWRQSGEPEFDRSDYDKLEEIAES